MRRSVSDHVADARHAGSLDGATLQGEASSPSRLAVRVGLWLDEAGNVSRGRFLASPCATLIAYAEAACTLAEEGVPLGALRAERLRRAVSGVHAVHLDRADLVALAIFRALGRQAEQPGASP